VCWQLAHCFDNDTISYVLAIYILNLLSSVHSYHLNTD
jgi:hypothetical protein